MQNSLFDQDNSQTGYRLEQLEIFNWGTFNKKIYSLNPKGKTSLLTGANGSGKSTLADALLTLIVPSRRRNYNLSSGGGRRERTEKTYFLGAWGRAKSSDDYVEKTKYLREPGDYSVLLVTFKNSGSLKTVTLAQVFWMNNDELKKIFVVGECALSIQEHFSQFRNPTELKKQLRKLSESISVYDQFNQYSSHFMRLVGLRSEKALDLFNQTVAIKEIESLNAFVRKHMLEEMETGEALYRLIQNFQNLNLANESIVKARRQLDTLSPLCRDLDECDGLQAQISELGQLKDSLPAVIEEQRLTLLRSRLQAWQQDVLKTQDLLDQKNQILISLSETIEELKHRIQGSHTGQQLELLDVRIQNLQKELTRCQNEAEHYNQLAQKLRLSRDPNSDQFHGARQRIQQDRELLRQRISALDKSSRDLDFKLRGRQEEKASLDQELRSLMERQGNIPHHSLRIRAQVARDLGVDESRLPFVGELIQVKDSELKWEAAIERLLHSLGLRVLVDEDLSAGVNGYVNSHHLKGKIVYSRIKLKSETYRPSSLDLNGLDERALFFKLDFRHDSPFEGWLKREVATHFDYICCTELDEFRKLSRALTPQGLIKRSSSLHEKDDRFDLNDRSRFVLGWDNQRKVQALKKSSVEKSQEIEGLQKELNQIEREKDLLVDQEAVMAEFLRIEDFDQIHWQQRAVEISHLEERRQLLIKQDQSLHQIKGQLEAKQGERRQIEGERSSLERKLGDLQGQVRRDEEGIESGEALLQIYSGTDYQKFAPSLLSRVKRLRLKLDYSELNETQRRVLQSLEAEMETLRKKRTDLVNAITSRMVVFTKEFPEDCQEMEPRMEYQAQFQALQARISKDDLPRHEERFRKLLNRNIANDLTGFKSSLERGEESIRESIDQLNRALRLIDFSPSTFVQIEVSRSLDQEIRGFQSRLRDCIPDASQTEFEAYQESFYKIKQLIDQLKEEERWKEKVVDVRNWLDFAVTEIYTEDRSQARYYSDSSGLSGGQKAKLAYTILASAIAYQYGLSAEDLTTESFRFALIDEAFSKSDDMNSRYAMQLFERLNLQLMVVTPMDKIHVVEPHIDVIHFVSNNDERNDSKVSEISRETYQEERLRRQQSLTPASLEPVHG